MTQLTFIDIDTDLTALLSPYENLTYIDTDTDLTELLSSYENKEIKTEPVTTIKTIKGIAKADLVIYKKYEALFITEVSSYISSVVGEVASVETITRHITTMGFVNFHSTYTSDFQGLINSLGLTDEHYFVGDNIFKTYKALYNEESEMIRYGCNTENLYDKYIMSL